MRRVCNLVAEVNNRNTCFVREKNSPYILFGAAESRKKDGSRLLQVPLEQVSVVSSYSII